MEAMAEAPKEFRKPVLEPLKIAEAPHAEAHTAFNAGQQNRGASAGNSLIARGTVKAGSAVESGVAMRQPGMPITFDRKTQSFSRVAAGDGERQAEHGGGAAGRGRKWLSCGAWHGELWRRAERDVLLEWRRRRAVERACALV